MFLFFFPPRRGLSKSATLFVAACSASGFGGGWGHQRGAAGPRAAEGALRGFRGGGVGGATLPGATRGSGLFLIWGRLRIHFAYYLWLKVRQTIKFGGVKNRYPKLNPGKWKHGIRPVVSWENIDPYPFYIFCACSK